MELFKPHLIEASFKFRHGLYSDGKIPDTHWIGVLMCCRAGMSIVENKDSLSVPGIKFWSCSTYQNNTTFIHFLGLKE